MKLFFDKRRHGDLVNHMLSAEFLLEEGKWKFTRNIHDADVVPVNYDPNGNNTILKLQNNQILLVWFYETSGDGFTPNKCRIDTKYFLEKNHKTLVFHTNEIDNSDPQYIPCNVMFNRQKMFCTDYTDICNHLQWTAHTPKIAFELSNIDKKYSLDNKTFLVPNRIFRNSNNAINNLRIKLKHFMESINASMYMSDPELGIYLKPNGVSDVSNIDTVAGGSWYPIDNYYYNTSYIGIHTEVIVENPSIFYPSEKYFDILIKGSFPLVFSSAKAIYNLKQNYGFEFPDWIDYSYDDIYDINERFESFTQSIKKVNEKSITELHDLYLRDRHILDHNKNIFFTRPYHSVYDKVKDSIKKLGW